MRARFFTRFLPAACLVSLLLVGPSPAVASLPAQADGTIILVNTVYDLEPGYQVCTLRNAIIAANRDEPVGRCPAGNGVDTIRVPAGVYEIRLEQAGEDEAGSGDLDILASVLVEGMGSGVSIIQAAEQQVALDRIFHIHAGAVVEMRSLQIRRANFAPPEPDSAVEHYLGGGILNAGSLRLNNVKLYQNRAAGEGGGIYNTGSLEIRGSIFALNESGSSGGAISNHGSLALANSSFNKNNASDGGAVANAAAAQAEISGTDFIENRGSNTGGAIHQLGRMTLRESEFWLNHSVDGAGALHTAGDLLIEDSLFQANEGSTGIAAIHQSGGALTVRRSRFLRNLGMTGGALVIDQTVGTRVEECLFQDNSAYHGVGIKHGNGPTTIVRSTFIGNNGYSGGGIEVYGSGVRITGCTFRGNQASDFGGSAIKVTGEALIENSTITANHAWNDGALLVEHGKATLIHSTVAYNEGVGVVNSGGEISIRASIIAKNTTDGGNPSPMDCAELDEDNPGRIISLGSNLLGTLKNCPWTSIPGDQTGGETTLLDPRIADLADNGGPTWTHALLPDSPAVDAAGTSCPEADQRGVPRPQGAACDIGAFELQAPEPVILDWQYLPVIQR